MFVMMTCGMNPYSRNSREYRSRGEFFPTVIGAVPSCGWVSTFRALDIRRTRPSRPEPGRVGSPDLGRRCGINPVDRSSWTYPNGFIGGSSGKPIHGETPQRCFQANSVAWRSSFRRRPESLARRGSPAGAVRRRRPADPGRPCAYGGTATGDGGVVRPSSCRRPAGACAVGASACGTRSTRPAACSEGEAGTWFARADLQPLRSLLGNRSAGSRRRQPRGCALPPACKDRRCPARRSAGGKAFPDGGSSACPPSDGSIPILLNRKPTEDAAPAARRSARVPHAIGIEP